MWATLEPGRRQHGKTSTTKRRYKHFFFVFPRYYDISCDSFGQGLAVGISARVVVVRGGDRASKGGANFGTYSAWTLCGAEKNFSDRVLAAVAAYRRDAHWLRLLLYIVVKIIL